MPAFLGLLAGVSSAAPARMGLKPGPDPLPAGCFCRGLARCSRLRRARPLWCMCSYSGDDWGQMKAQPGPLRPTQEPSGHCMASWAQKICSSGAAGILGVFSCAQDVRKNVVAITRRVVWLMVFSLPDVNCPSSKLQLRTYLEQPKKPGSIPGTARASQSGCCIRRNRGCEISFRTRMENMQAKEAPQSGRGDFSILRRKR